LCKIIMGQMQNVNTKPEERGASCFVSRSEEETFDLGRKIGEGLRGGDVLVLSAPLGAGKTVLAKGIASGLGIKEAITSPSFTIVNEYGIDGNSGGEDKGAKAFYHIDVWRLRGEDDFEAIGGVELFNGNSICIIEWGERIKGLLPENNLNIKMEILENGDRRVTLGRR